MTDAGTTSGTLSDSTITDAGDGWYRCSITAKTDEANGTPIYQMVESKSSNTFDSSGLVAYAGTSTTLSLWQAQAELGNLPTSPIPTYAATLTRAKDDVFAKLTTVPFSDTVGTIVLEYQLMDIAGYQALVSIDDGTNQDQIFIYNHGSNDSFVFRMYDGGSTEVATEAGTSTTSKQTNAIAWAVNDVQGANDGTAHTVDESATIPTDLTDLQIGMDRNAEAGIMKNGRIFNVLYLPRRATAIELAELTL
jgi:hypothetical protein